MKQIVFCLFLLLMFQPQVKANYLDSLDKYITTLPEKDQLGTVLEIPYDKIVANTAAAEVLFLKYLKKAKNNNEQEFEADIYNQLALTSSFLGNYDKSLNYNLNAIKIYELIGNKSKAGLTYASLGFSMKRRNVVKAKSYMKKGILLLEESEDLIALNPSYDNYGIVLEIDGQVDSAIYYYNLALNLKRDQNDSIGIPFALGHLSGAYLIKKDYKKSKAYLDESYRIRKSRNDVYGIAECLVLYADFYYAQKNYEEALVWFESSYEAGIKSSYIHLAQYAAEHAAICSEKIGDIEKAVRFLKVQQNLKDSLLNESTNKNIAELETKYETEKKEKEIAEQKAKISLQQLKAKQRNYMLLGLVVLVVFIVMIAYFVYRQQKQKQERLIEENRLKDQLALVTVQNKLHEERLRISRDLHDNIGSQLTFIISSVDNMKHVFKSSDDKLKNKLSGVANFTRTTITQLRDTIWALNKDEISLEDLKSRLYNYIEDANLTQEQTKFNFKSNISSNLTLNPVQGVNMYRIVQEAINNAMKYAAATNVSLYISETEEAITLVVSDDGIGFNLSEIKLGNGLENMRNRAAEIEAGFIVNSDISKGTEIELIVKKSSLN